jgi:hypothetical protein
MLHVSMFFGYPVGTTATVTLTNMTRFGSLFTTSNGLLIGVEALFQKNSGWIA